MPNSTVYQRESKLYADIEAYEDGKPRWSAPGNPLYRFSSFAPPALRLAEAMSALGIFTPKGVKATAEIWGQVEFKDTESNHEADHLTQQLVKRLIEKGLPVDIATQDDVNPLYAWQLPMYGCDFTRIDIPLKKLKAEQDRVLWAESGC